MYEMVIEIEIGIEWYITVWDSYNVFNKVYFFENLMIKMVCSANFQNGQWDI